MLVHTLKVSSHNTIFKWAYLFETIVNDQQTLNQKYVF